MTAKTASSINPYARRTRQSDDGTGILIPNGICNADMPPELYCPECDNERSFELTAFTSIDLGEKRKLRCGECGYERVRVGEIDSAEAGA